jgi:hypothetical protein
MTRHELLDCMHEAVEALADFRPVLSEHSPEAQTQVSAAKRHLQWAIALLELRGADAARTSPRRRE